MATEDVMMQWAKSGIYLEAIRDFPPPEIQS